jgi:hypothetical protein
MSMSAGFRAGFRGCGISTISRAGSNAAGAAPVQAGLLPPAHEALPVTRGTRYCTLPFLYDEAGAKVREQNLAYLADEGLRTQLERNLLGQKPGAT